MRPRVPESIPDVSLSYWPMTDSMGPVVSWRTWKHLRGGGLRQWLSFVWRFGMVSQEEKQRDEHECYVQERRCHAYQGREFHYCGRRRGRVFPLA